MTSPTINVDVMIATKEDISRLENSIRELAKSVQDMILIQERQTVQGQRIGDLETENGILKQNLSSVKEAVDLKVAALDKKVDGWINRTVGAWFVITILGGIAVALLELIRH